MPPAVLGSFTVARSPVTLARRVEALVSALAGATTPIDIIPTINETTASHNALCLIFDVILKNLSLTLIGDS